MPPGEVAGAATAAAGSWSSRSIGRSLEGAGRGDGWVDGWGGVLKWTLKRTLRGVYRNAACAANSRRFASAAWLGGLGGGGGLPPFRLDRAPSAAPAAITTPVFASPSSRLAVARGGTRRAARARCRRRPGARSHRDRGAAIEPPPRRRRPRRACAPGCMLRAAAGPPAASAFRCCVRIPPQHLLQQQLLACRCNSIRNSSCPPAPAPGSPQPTHDCGQPCIHRWVERARARARCHALHLF